MFFFSAIRTYVINQLVLSHVNTFFLPRRKNPQVSQDLLIVEDSRSHSDTAHSVGLLWTSDQPDAETST